MMLIGDLEGSAPAAAVPGARGGRGRKPSILTGTTPGVLRHGWQGMRGLRVWARWQRQLSVGSRMAKRGLAPAANRTGKKPRQKG
jgi:hypothetical protein